MSKILKLESGDRTKKLVWLDHFGKYESLYTLVSVFMNSQSGFELVFALGGKEVVVRSQAELDRFLEEAKAVERIVCKPREIRGNSVLSEAQLGTVQDFLAFATGNYSPYNVVSKIEGILLANGFKELLGDRPWVVNTGGKYYVKRAFSSSIAAFSIPKQLLNGKAFSYNIAATHSDSPCPRLASKTQVFGSGYDQMNVQIYGGGLWRTWFDRELAVGGRVVVKTSEGLAVRSYASKGAIAFIPSLPPHLFKPENEALNREIHLRPITGISADKPSPDGQLDFLLEDIASSLAVARENILAFDLCLADQNPPALFGSANQFVASARLDNNLSAWAGLSGFLEVPETAANQQVIPLYFCFDHEEIGSASTSGADSDFCETVIERATAALSSRADIYDTKMASFLISADVGHAYNPNYDSNFKSGYKPIANKGNLIKINDSMKYVTNSISRAWVSCVAKEHNLHLQEFMVGNESPSGSTLGVFLAKRLGCLSVDIGAPVLAMHSAREFVGSLDVVEYKELFKHLLATPLPEIADRRA